ncbi:MAG: hypothetical protein NTZ05_18645 [Chloroflexi bacterium]|nr:hypothetical protein [Chloroflexota bacterium]
MDMADQEKKMFDMERNDDGSMTFTVRPPKLDFEPGGVAAHVLAAQKEMLLAVRSLLDGALAATDKREKGTGGSRRTRIDVD